MRHTKCGGALLKRAISWSDWGWPNHPNKGKVHGIVMTIVRARYGVATPLFPRFEYSSMLHVHECSMDLSLQARLRKKHRWDRLVYLLSRQKWLCCMTRPQPSLSMSCDEEVLHIFFFLSFILSYFTLFFSSFPSTVNLIGLTVSYSNIWVMRLNHCGYVRQSCKRIKKKSCPTPSLFYIHWLLFFWIPTTPFWIN